MSEEILTLGNIEIWKNKFYRHKTLIFLKCVDIEKVMVSNNNSSGKKTINTLLVTGKMIVTLSKYI